ncbi:MAG: thiol-disulfide oxidoreductase DCC family protein [Porticoccaceae bacterium]
MAILTIFYDGGCPLCAAEITHLIRLNSENKLAFENIYAPDFAERFGHIDRQAADRVLHGQLATGEMIYGLEVTYEAWAMVGKRHWVAILRWPVFRQCAQLGYRFFARHRHRISRLLMGKARCERCALAGRSE